jgi:hypothetical protein
MNLIDIDNNIPNLIQVDPRVYPPSEKLPYQYRSFCGKYPKRLVTEKFRQITKEIAALLVSLPK